MNRIFAIPVAAPAIPPKPSTAATMAMMRKVIAQLSMVVLLSFSESVRIGRSEDPTVLWYDIFQGGRGGSRLASGQRVSGLIVNFPLEDDDAATVAAACGGVPVLFLDVSDSSPINSVSFSHEAGARLGVERLVVCGHRRIALLAGPQSSVAARQRLAGWHRWLAQHQLQPLAQLEGDWSAISGFEETRRLLNGGTVPQALLVANDQMALGAMRAISEYGLRVPADISVIGYDDTEDSSCYIPPLTTVKQDFPLLGQSSVDRLLRMTQGETITGNQLLSVTLVERQTVSAPGAHAASPQALADTLLQISRQLAQMKPEG